jgi:hypothetical protein
MITFWDIAPYSLEVGRHQGDDQQKGPKIIADLKYKDLWKKINEI